MKDQDAIQRAHDLLHYLGDPKGDAPAILDRDSAIAAHAVHDALAWVLGFPCGEAFQNNLDVLFAYLRTLGIGEVDMGEPQ